MNWYKIFYWLTVSDGVKGFFDTVSNIFTFLTVVLFIGLIVVTIAKYVTSSDKNIVKIDSNNNVDMSKLSTNIEVFSLEMLRKYISRTFYISLFLALISWLCWAAIPTKKDCLLIIAGGTVGNYIQSDSTVRELPKDFTKYLHLSLQKEIKNLNEESRSELGLTVQTEKDKYVDKLKDMTKEEIIQFINSDTTLIR